MIKFLKSTLTCLSLGVALSSAAFADECEIIVGVVPQFQQRHLLTTWTPFLSELGDRTQCSYTLVGSANIPEFETQFKAGLFDLVYLNPYHFVVAMEVEGYIPIVRSGSKMLQGVLVVRKDSDIESIFELDGREVAFPSPNALGASLLMRAELAMLHGVQVVPKYATTHNSVYLNVFKELALAGGGIERSLNGEEPQIRDQLKILYRTQKVNAHPIVVHPRIDPLLRNKIKKAIINISQTMPTLTEGIPLQEAVAASFEDYMELSGLGLEKFAADQHETQ